MTAAPVSCNLRSELQVGRTLQSVTSKLYLGASGEPLGGLLEPLESLLGASWGPLGGPLGASLGPLRGLLGASPLAGLLKASWGPLGGL